MSFTQPCCSLCWDEKNPGREPCRIRAAEREYCCYCGCITFAGIYVRADPGTVAYPSKEEESV